MEVLVELAFYLLFRVAEVSAAFVYRHPIRAIVFRLGMAALFLFVFHRPLLRAAGFGAATTGINLSLGARSLAVAALGFGTLVLCLGEGIFVAPGSAQPHMVGGSLARLRCRDGHRCAGTRMTLRDADCHNQVILQGRSRCD